MAGRHCPAGFSAYVPHMDHVSRDNRPPPPQASQIGAPGFLWTLVGIMVAIELVLSLSDAGYIGATGLRWQAYALGAFWQPVFAGTIPPAWPGQTVAMFLTHAFLHGGLMHLALNSVILLSLGKFVTSRVGPARTLAVLCLSAVGGALLFGLLAFTNAPMIGASGAVFGLVGLWQADEYYLRRRHGLTLKPVFTAILGLAAANVAFFVMLSGGLAWEAHLGGWLAGGLAGLVLLRNR